MAHTSPVEDGYALAEIRANPLYAIRLITKTTAAFWAIDANREIYSSADAVTWTNQTTAMKTALGITSGLDSMHFCGLQAIGANVFTVIRCAYLPGYSVIWYAVTYTGAAWTKVDISAYKAFDTYSAVIGDLSVANSVLFLGESKGLFYTTDGTTWNTAFTVSPPLSGDPTYTVVRNVIYLSGTYYAWVRREPATGSTVSYQLYTSTNLTDWTSTATTGLPSGAFDPVFNVGSYFYMGWSVLYESSNGVAWTLKYDEFVYGSMHLNVSFAPLGNGVLAAANYVYYLPYAKNRIENADYRTSIGGSAEFLYFSSPPFIYNGRVYLSVYKAYQFKYDSTWDDGDTTRPSLYSGNSFTVYKNSQFKLGPDSITTLVPALFPSIPAVFVGNQLPTISSSPTHGTALFAEEESLSYSFTYTPTTDYTGSDSLTIDGSNIDGINYSLVLSITVAVPETLAITPISDQTLSINDLVSGTLFSVIGGATEYRTCSISLLGTMPWEKSVNYNYQDTVMNSSITVPSRNLPQNTDVAYTIDAADFLSNNNTSFYFKSSGFCYLTLRITDGSPTPAQTDEATVKFTIYDSLGNPPDPLDDPGVPPPPAGTGIIQGTLRLDTSAGAFAARKVYLYSYTTGVKIAETTSDGTTGAWSFAGLTSGEYFVVGAAQGADLSVPRDFDALGVITVA